MRTIARTAAASAASAVVGSVASRDVRSGWYARLSKPSFQPPPVAFPIVWTALYTDIAVSSATVIDALREDGRAAEAAAFERALALSAAIWRRNR
jgi:translocator protein